ncbi:MAG: DUF3037 domain-containing protein [Bacteroidota bacterium]
MPATRPPAAPPVWIDYDYAVVRVVPSVARGAFVNVGVVLHARRARFLEARLHPDVTTWPDLAVLPDPLLRGALDAYTAVCAGHGVIGCYPPSERFHWLTAPRSAALRTSPVHSGRTTDPAATLAALYEAVVLG